MTNGLSFSERQQLIRHQIAKLGIPCRDLDGKELRAEVEGFLKKKQCLVLATVTPEGHPHQTILDYQSQGLDLYIASEGGDKFRNLDHLDIVSVSIGFSDGTVESEYGLTMKGRASVFRAPHPKFALGMAKMRHFLTNWSRALQPMENILKRAIEARLIIITPTEFRYMNIPEGIPLSEWSR